jgi:hypothetical protein
MDNEAVGELAETLATLVNGGESIEGAVGRLSRYGTPADMMQLARRQYEERTGRIRDLRDPGALVDRQRSHGYWYAGPQTTDAFWPGVRSHLGLDETALDSVDRSSSKIVSLLDPPGRTRIETRGLVLGYVQSGKTTSFMSVIAKAADVGYRCFIVLSGVTDNLRSQTQARIDEVVVGNLGHRWFRLTDAEADFHQSENAGNLLSSPEQRLIGVVKKNPYRLRRLVRWLESAGPALAGCPILLIDDEADQASIDVGSKGRVSKINGLIGQILKKPKAAYVAYSATPFANLLIDAGDDDGLYPRDFVVDLPRSDAYFGPERIFGRESLDPDEDPSELSEGMDIVRHIDEADAALIRPPSGKGGVEDWVPQIGPSLRDAVSWFLLATAARRVRGSGNPHSTMLIHSSMIAKAHMRTRAPVETVVRNLRIGVHSGDPAVIDPLRTQWEAETARVPCAAADEPIVWAKLVEELAGVLEDTRVVIDNYLSTERLSYDDDRPATAIVIGGNTLSRGLTLEGLVCSYFVRAASAYDTLLQMGRWFGYRAGYGDLTRVWMTPELEEWFFDLATVEEEIRRDIRRYEDEGRTPSELAVKIRRHPALAITSAAKMRNAVSAEISYSGSRQQTILFEHRNAGWLLENQEAVRSLVRSSLQAGAKAETGLRQGHRILRAVDAGRVLDFIADYNFHDRAFQMRPDLLTGYIEGQRREGALDLWNIVVLGHPDPTNGTIPLGFDDEVNMIQRSRMDIPGLPHANIKSLVSTIDRAVDLGRTTQEITGMVDHPVTDARLLDLREDLLGAVGLLCLYPISKRSKPDPHRQKDGQRRRLPLDAVEDVIGAGFFFPKGRGATAAYSYVSANLSSQRVEEPEDDLDMMDERDEANDTAVGA